MEELFNEGKKKKKEWKFGKKHNIRGTTDAALKHHPEKFSKDACKKDGDGDKLCPYAVFTNMAKKKKVKSTYKDKSTIDKKKPVKKKVAKKKKLGESFANYITKRNPEVFSEWGRETFHIDTDGGRYVVLNQGQQIARGDDPDVLDRKLKRKYQGCKVVHMYPSAVRVMEKRDKEEELKRLQAGGERPVWGRTVPPGQSF